VPLFEYGRSPAPCVFPMFTNSDIQPSWGDSSTRRLELWRTPGSSVVASESSTSMLPAFSAAAADSWLESRL